MTGYGFQDSSGNASLASFKRFRTIYFDGKGMGMPILYPYRTQIQNMRSLQEIEKKSQILSPLIKV